MKKHLLLGLVPALMALSACNGAQPVENNIFLEDTNAHYELFGGSQEINELKGRRNEKTTTPSKPAIGYQIKYEGDYLSIRFIAALKELDVTASWKRGVAGPDGSELRSKSFKDDAQETTTYYTSLTDGKKTIIAGDGDYAGYQGFVVYTLRNIPYTANKDAYVAAYVNVTGTDTVSSEILAVKVEKKDSVLESKNSFSFSTSYEGDGKHFLQGTIGGEKKVLGATEWNGGENYASYYDVFMKQDDSFGSFYYTATTFRFYSYSNYVVEHAGDYFETSSLSGYSKPKYDGEFDLYVSSGDADKIYASAIRLTEYSFSANAAAALPDDSTNYFVSCWGGASGTYVDVVNKTTNKVYLASDATGFLAGMTTATSGKDVIFPGGETPSNITNQSSDGVLLENETTLYYHNYIYDANNHFIAASKLYNITFKVNVTGQTIGSSVNLPGNFNNWNKSVPMTNLGDNIYSLTINDLPHGFWPTFKFVLDDDWNKSEAVNRFFPITGNESTLEFDWNKSVVNVELGEYTTAGAVVYAWAWKDNQPGSWYAYDSVNKCFEVTGCNKIKFVRMPGGTVTPSWDAKWTESNELDIRAVGTATCISLSDGFEWR